MTVKAATAIYNKISKRDLSKLTAIEWRAFRGAIAALRAARKPLAKNPPSGKPVKIYERVLRIEAQKGRGHRCDPGCVKTRHCYYHDFKSGGSVNAYGMPDGTVLLVGTKGQKLWAMFD